MLWLDLRLALVTFASLPILILGTGWFQRLLRSCYREIRKRTAALNSYLQESISGIRLIQLFGREPRTKEQFEDRNRALIGENFRSQSTFQWPGADQGMLWAVSQASPLRRIHGRLPRVVTRRNIRPEPRERDPAQVAALKFSPARLRC